MTVSPAILITGASRRLGKAIALRLAQEGYAIALHYRNSSIDAQVLKHEIEAQGGVCQLFQADLKGRSACKALIEDVYRQLPGLCGLIHNASVFVESRFLETDEAQLETFLSIHLKAPFWLTQSFAHIVKAGSVITMLDTDILQNAERFFTYTLTKRMLAEFTTMSAKVLAPAIRVNGIAPGKVLPSIDCDETYLEYKRMQLPLKTLPTPEDIAASAVLLLQTPYLTGHILFVDGGEQLV